MIRFFIAAACGAVLLGSVRVALAQEFSIEAYSIEALGATSSGGEFTLSGSVGPSEPVRMTGGEFTLEGGFWALITAIQTPGLPRLIVEWTPNQLVRVAWSADYPDFQLQQSASLPSGVWTAVTNAPVAVPGQWEVLLPPSQGQNFYRLTQPR